MLASALKSYVAKGIALCLSCSAQFVFAAFAAPEIPPDRAQIIEILRFGQVDLSPGVALELPQEHSQLQIRRIGLRLDGYAIRAAFRDKTRRIPRSRKLNVRYLDTYYNEVAAYVVSRLLGLDLVPPTVLRDIHVTESGLEYSSTPRPGSLQLWIENAAVEYDFQKGGRRYPGSKLHKNQQLSEILVLDCIIGNADRHAGNILVDLKPHYPLGSKQEDKKPLLGKLWAIDHSRAFHRSTRVDSGNCRLSGLARQPISLVFIEGMRQWDEARATAALRDAAMSAKQIDTLHLNALTRRLEKVRARIEEMQNTAGLSDAEFYSSGNWHRVR